ncbi:hypothetical protein HMPREF1557_01087 [Streptococcus sobrinus W1703]|uniref:Uncharacterized protein n=1 Tax=Streptococcus sobrinus W1703 TaxID=1227275 RepID=U2J901_9STRE|nr:hypothetical protein HMPREF1557_01087 [Streptococcus sobrinus W1703]
MGNQFFKNRLDDFINRMDFKIVGLLSLISQKVSEMLTLIRIS